MKGIILCSLFLIVAICCSYGAPVETQPSAKKSARAVGASISTRVHIKPTSTKSYIDTHPHPKKRHLKRHHRLQYRRPRHKLIYPLKARLQYYGGEHIPLMPSAKAKHEEANIEMTNGEVFEHGGVPDLRRRSTRLIYSQLHHDENHSNDNILSEIQGEDDPDGNKNDMASSADIKHGQEGSSSTVASITSGESMSGESGVDVYLKNNEQVSIKQGPEPHLEFQPRVHGEYSEGLISDNIDYLLKGFQDIFGNTTEVSTKHATKDSNGSSSIYINNIDHLLKGYKEIFTNKTVKPVREDDGQISLVNNKIDKMVQSYLDEGSNQTVGTSIQGKNESLKLHAVNDLEIISNMTKPYYGASSDIEPPKEPEGNNAIDTTNHNPVEPAVVENKIAPIIKPQEQTNDRENVSSDVPQPTPKTSGSSQNSGQNNDIKDASSVQNNGVLKQSKSNTSPGSYPTFSANEGPNYNIYQDNANNYGDSVSATIQDAYGLTPIKQTDETSVRDTGTANDEKANVSPGNNPQFGPSEGPNYSIYNDNANNFGDSVSASVSDTNKMYAQKARNTLSLTPQVESKAAPAPAPNIKTFSSNSALANSAHLQVCQNNVNCDGRHNIGDGGNNTSATDTTIHISPSTVAVHTEPGQQVKVNGMHQEIEVGPHSSSSWSAPLSKSVPPNPSIEDGHGGALDHNSKSDKSPGVITFSKSNDDARNSGLRVSHILEHSLDNNNLKGQQSGIGENMLTKSITSSMKSNAGMRPSPPVQDGFNGISSISEMVEPQLIKGMNTPLIQQSISGQQFPYYQGKGQQSFGMDGMEASEVVQGLPDPNNEDRLIHGLQDPANNPFLDNNLDEGPVSFTPGFRYSKRFSSPLYKSKTISTQKHQKQKKKRKPRKHKQHIKD